MEVGVYPTAQPDRSICVLQAILVGVGATCGGKDGAGDVSDDAAFVNGKDRS